jgi:hypothetical protein
MGISAGSSGITVSKTETLIANLVELSHPFIV